MHQLSHSTDAGPRRLIALLLLLSVFPWGCAVPVMREVHESHTPSSDHAIVTFLRPTGDGGPIKFGIWDNDAFIGVLRSRHRIEYLAAPGKHLFIGRAENWSFLSATLEAGKRYYVLSRVLPGDWKAQVALSPVVPGTTERETLEQWISECTLSEVVPEQRATYQTPRRQQVREAIGVFEAGGVPSETLDATAAWPL